MLGYPPRKNADTSIGDAINWEWIVHCAKESGKAVVIVSRDTDYGICYDKQFYLNDWLRQEFSERVSKTRKVMLTDRLAEGFKLVSVKVSAAAEQEEKELLSEVVADLRVSYNIGEAVSGARQIVTMDRSQAPARDLNR